MKVLVAVLLLSAAVWAKAPEPFQVDENEFTPYNYHEKIGIPKAAKIKAQEEASKATRIIGGAAAELGAYPYQAGIVITLDNGLTSACGASLLTNTRLVTAAHCWWDGQTQAVQFVIVLGSVRLFFGGTRIITTAVHMHAGWNTQTFANDIAMVYVPWVNYSNTIRNIALPGNNLNQNFVGLWGWASGFGRTSDSAGISIDSFLSHVRLQVITNAVCAQSYGSFILDSNLCTSGAGFVGTCTGDSGGPMALDWDGQRILVGVTSFGSNRCEAGFPSVFARITYYFSWIQSHL